MADSLCCTAETNTVKQLYSNKKIKNRRQKVCKQQGPTLKHRELLIYSVSCNKSKWMGWVGDGREGTYVYLWLIHVDVWQKPT